MKFWFFFIFHSFELFAVSLERWCRLRGNLLFYFKSSDQFSEPQGVIVLEKCEPVIRNERREHDGYVFFIGKFEYLKYTIPGDGAHSFEYFFCSLFV